MEETAEQELARRLQQPAATQSSGSYSACSRLNAVNVLRTDFDTGDQCYVFHVAASTHNGTVAAALSNHAVKLYTTRDSGGFTYLGELKGHTGVVSEIAFAGDDNPHALYSSSEDGSIRGWDSRTGQQAQRFSQFLFQLACKTCGAHRRVTQTYAAVLHLGPANCLLSALLEISWRVGQRAKSCFGTRAQESSVGLLLTHTLRM